MGEMVKSFQGCRSCQKVREQREKRKEVCNWCRRKVT